MKWVGLTGGIGCGKSTVSNIFRDLGVSVVDADAIARLVMAPGSKAEAKIKTLFGDRLPISPSGIDRKALGKIVFTDPEKKSQLESILHPLIRAEVNRQRRVLSETGEKFSVYDVPLLFEKEMTNDFDVILVVSCSEDLQIQRVMGRDGLLETEVRQRLANQISLAQKEAGADILIYNNSTREALEKRIIEVVTDLRLL